MQCPKNSDQRKNVFAGNSITIGKTNPWCYIVDINVYNIKHNHKYSTPKAKIKYITKQILLLLLKYKIKILQSKEFINYKQSHQVSYNMEFLIYAPNNIIFSVARKRPKSHKILQNLEIIPTRGISRSFGISGPTRTLWLQSILGVRDRWRQRIFTNGNYFTKVFVSNRQHCFF